MIKNRILVALATLGFVAALPSAVFAGELVTNGGFESNTNGNGQLGYNTDATGWTIGGDPYNSYTFLFAPGTADTTGANGVYGNVVLYGPGNGVANGLPATSPNGGYFIGMDSSFQQSAISQTINGLTAGNSYTVNFFWAAAQQKPFSGATADFWNVSLGSQTLTTSTLSIGTAGFSGWQKASLTFTADNTSDVLSFIANIPAGTNGGQPPFALLDGVSIQSTPETNTGVTMLLGVVGFGVFARRRARSNKSSK